MRHARAQRFCLSAIGALLLVVPVPATAQVGHTLYDCANRIATAVREYTLDGSDALLGCEVDRLTAGDPSDCATDPDLADRLGVDLLEEAANQANNAVCDTAGNPEDQSTSRFRAICPLESRTTTLFSDHVGTTEPGTMRSELTAVAQDLFVTAYPGCARPTGTVRGDDRNCATGLAQIASDRMHEMVKCFTSCERNNLASNDFCVEPESGEPDNDEVVSCLADQVGSVDELLGDCSDESVTALGCPLGAESAEALVDALAARLRDYAQSLNLATFHASCRTSVPGPPVELVPAEVTLEPSLRKAQVSCGQVLDAAFFGTDNVVRFDTDLNCVPVTEAVDGIVIDRNNVTVNGRGERQIFGPGSSSLRTGAGIRVAAGRKRVKITGFRRIQRFAVGILAEGGNKQLRLNNVTLFRNIEAGVRASSPNMKLISVVADRNGVGFDIGGNNVQMRLTESRGSDPQRRTAADPFSTGWGYRLSGTDGDLNGITVRCSQCSATGDVVGFVLEGDGHLVENSTVRDAVTDGVHVDGTAIRFRNNSVKTSVGTGIVVNGTANVIEKNQSDENDGHGFLFVGTANVVTGNGAGSLTDKGNGGVGYVVTGADNLFDTNEAEANLGGGFSVQAPQALFKGNRAESNTLIGFDIAAEGNALESNVAEKNTGSEFVVAPNNVDEDGNRANGSTIAIPPAGGAFE